MTMKMKTLRCQNAADREFQATDPANAPVRAEFRLGLFPPDHHVPPAANRCRELVRFLPEQPDYVRWCQIILDKGESRKYRQPHKKNRATPCGISILLGR